MEQLLSGAEKYTEKTFGPAAVDKDKAKTEALEGKVMKDGPDTAAGAANPFLETYRTRFRREGALAAIEQMRNRQTRANSPQISN